MAHPASLHSMRHWAGRPPALGVGRLLHRRPARMPQLAQSSGQELGAELELGDSGAGGGDGTTVATSSSGGRVGVLEPSTAPSETAPAAPAAPTEAASGGSSSDGSGGSDSTSSQPETAAGTAHDAPKEDEEQRLRGLMREALSLSDRAAVVVRLLELSGQHPGNIHFRLAAANSQARLGRHDAAAATYAAAAEVAAAQGSARWQSEVLQQWGISEARRGRLDAARSLFERSIAADPSHAAAHHALGKLEERLGCTAEALRQYEAGLKADSGHVHSLQSQAVLEARLGNTPAALKLFKQASEQAALSWGFPYNCSREPACVQL